MLGHSMEFRRPDNGPIVDSDRGTANVQEMETLKSWMDETKVFGGSWWSCKIPGNNWILAHDNIHSRIYFFHMLKLNAWTHWTHSRMLNITTLNGPQTFFLLIFELWRLLARILYCYCERELSATGRARVVTAAHLDCVLKSPILIFPFWSH